MSFSSAMSAFSAVQSISQGYAQSAEDKYNANISSIQAQDLGIQGQITQGQYTRGLENVLTRPKTRKNGGYSGKMGENGENGGK